MMVIWPVLLLWFPADNSANEALAVFKARCAACHAGVKPKGNFGYILDLPKVAANPKLIVPGKQDESRLWRLVKDGDMPPEGSPALTRAEKEAVRAWIAAGAPLPAEVLPLIEPPAEVPEQPRPGPIERTFLWLGKLHIILIHFPIALVFVAAICEAWAWWRGVREPLLVVRLCLLIAAASAALTVALGWLHASHGYGSGQPGLLIWHRWLGTAAGFLLLWAGVGSELDAMEDNKRSPHTRFLIFASALLTGVAAHPGGGLVHGPDFLEW